MIPPILVIDGTYLCHRAFHALSELHTEGVGTGVAFGVFRELALLREQFATDDLVVCFDQGPLKRKAVSSEYKANRRKGETSDQKALRSELHRQMDLFRSKWLPAIGLHNVFWEEGYEADDLIASLCATCETDEMIVIIGSDADLYQCLGTRVNLWNPQKKRYITQQKFTDEFGINPDRWADVKAIAGCSSDNVKGVVGVGEKTAIKFLTGKLNPKTKAYDSIVAGHAIWQKNLELVRLPFPGTPDLDLTTNQFSKRKWDAVMDEMGLKSLRY